MRHSKSPQSFLRATGAASVLSLALLSVPARASTGQDHPQRFCNILAKDPAGGFTALELQWKKEAKPSKQYFCNGMNHTDAADYYYDVYGTATKAQKIFIYAEFWQDTATKADTVSKEEIGRTLQPELARVFAAAGTATMPADLADAVGAANDMREDTVLGMVSAQNGTPTNPNYERMYLIEIDLH